jgi:hypothetical protein
LSAQVPFVSNSELTTFRTCRFRWYWTYMRRLKPRVAAPPLRFGTLIHASLDSYYKKGYTRGRRPSAVFRAKYKKELVEQVGMGFKDEDGKWEEAEELGADMLDHYVRHYGKDDEYEVVATEQRFESPIVTQRGNTVGIYVGVVDKLMRHIPTGWLEIWDHKSAKTIDTSYLALDSQKSGYWTFGVDWLVRKGILAETEKLRTIKFDFLRKAKEDQRHFRVEPMSGRRIYLNLDGSDSQKQPSDYFKRVPVPMSEAERELERLMVAEQLRDMALTRAGKLGIYKSPSKFNCGGCAVRDLCELHQVGGDFEEYASLMMVPKGEWTPIDYKNEEIARDMGDRPE